MFVKETPDRKKNAPQKAFQQRWWNAWKTLIFSKFGVLNQEITYSIVKMGLVEGPPGIDMENKGLSPNFA